MIGKKINQLATELAPVSTDLTIIGDPISGVSKKITLAQLGAIFSGAVSFYNDLASFPATGDINVIYCAKDTQKLYLWSGSAYVEVFPSQALLDTYQLRSEKGNANGYASLDSSGKVPISQLPSSIMEYKGTWSASTNTPTLANGTGDTGDVYLCNAAGTVNFGAGPLTFAVGDYVVYSGTIWQRSSGAVGTVTSVGLSITGDSIGVSNSPITTSGTLALAFAGTSGQYINGAGNLTTFPTLTGYVPYTGATANVDLGTFDLTADIITAATGSYTSSGGGNTLEVTHSSGSGIALNITKGGNGEGLYINKTSGSGNAATIVGTLEATTLVKTGGTSSQFLKADGSVDSSTYVTTDTFQNISASKTFAVGFNIASAGGTNQITNFANTNSLFSGSGGSNVFGFNSANNIYFGKGLDNGGVLSWNNSAVRYYTLPDATGTIALVGGSGVGTVTSVGLSSATSGVTIGSSPITTSGTITLAIATASGSQQGLLSSTDWTTFNNKQNALTNPVTGTGTTNYLPKFTGTSTIGNSAVSDDGTTVTLNSRALKFSADAWNTSADGLQRLYFSANSNTYLKGAGVIIRDNNDLNILTLATGGLATFSGTVNTPTKYTWGTANDGTTGQIATDNTNNYLDFKGNLYFRGAAASNTLMTLNASGNLSIGNTNDTYKLDVSGTGRFSGALSGTSATFSGNVISNKIGSATNAAFVASANATVGYAWTRTDQGTDAKNVDMIFDGSSILLRSVNDAVTSATNLLSITRSTGAATFSSSVTASSLTVGSLGSGSDAIISLATNASGSPRTIYYKASTAAINFTGTAGSDLMTLTNGGNLGIGTTSPDRPLDIYSASTVGIARIRANNTNGAAITIQNDENSQSISMYAAGSSGFGIGGWAGNAVLESITGVVYSAYNGNHIFQTGVSGRTERMRITSGGYLLLGTTTATYGQAGRGTFEMNGSTDNITVQKVGGSLANYIYSDATKTELYSTNFLQVSVNGSERMRITSGGDVGIGNTGDASVKLFVTGKDTSSNSYAALLRNSSGSNLLGVKNNGVINMGSLPTSSTGLSTGDLWNSAGTLKIV